MSDGTLPRLSVAMIVRNEAAFLDACLSQWAGLPCEHVVVDTGSTDDTIAIAEAHGSTLGHFPWCDDFSAARNAALALCTAPWIFVLDADERLAPEDLEALVQLAQGKPDCAYRIVTRNYTNLTTTGEFTPSPAGDPLAHGFAGWFPSAKVRLFPNRPAIRFAGQVHELVNASLAREKIPVHDVPLVVHHYGLSREPEALRRKQEAYLRLGLAKVASQPEDAQAFAELGHQYIELNDLPGALRAYRRAVTLAPNEGMYLRDLGSALVLAGRKAEALTAFMIATQQAPEDLDAWRNLGVLQAESGDWKGARDSFARGVALQPAHGELHRYLALALSECGDLETAHTHAHLAVKYLPQDVQAIALLRDLMARAGRASETDATLRALGAF